jgi:hypothetical protein
MKRYALALLFLALAVTVLFTKDGISVGQAERVFLLYISAQRSPKTRLRVG